MASAPARTAARIPASSVTPQIFTCGSRSSWPRAPTGSRPAATNARAAAAGSGERMSASPTSAASNPVARQRATGRRVADARTRRSAIRSPGIASRSRTARSGSTSSVRRSRLLMPIDPRARSRGRPRARGRRAPRRAAPARGPAPAPTSRARRFAGWSTASSRTRSAPAARRRSSCRGSTTNSLASTGTDDRGADRPQVVHGAAEPVRLAQDGDDRGAARGVGAGPRDGVVGRDDRRRPTASGA